MPYVRTYLLAAEIARHQAALDVDDETRAGFLEALGWTEVREGVWVVEGSEEETIARSEGEGAESIAAAAGEAEDIARGECDAEDSARSGGAVGQL